MERPYVAIENRNVTNFVRVFTKSKTSSVYVSFYEQQKLFLLQFFISSMVLICIVMNYTEIVWVLNHRCAKHLLVNRRG